MKKYKSWSFLNNQLESFLCDKLKNRISYFLTRYHKVHNAYGRASILLDKKEIVVFSWDKMYEQEYDYTQKYSFNDLKEKWDKNCTYYEMNFLSAITEYLNMSISDALKSDDYIILIFAIMDNRVGIRTLQKIKSEGKYLNYPEWVRLFYDLRFEISKL